LLRCGSSARAKIRKTHGSLLRLTRPQARLRRSELLGSTALSSTAAVAYELTPSWSTPTSLAHELLLMTRRKQCHIETQIRHSASPRRRFRCRHVDDHHLFPQSFAATYTYIIYSYIMATRGVFQLHKLSIYYCEHGGSSQMLRKYIASGRLSQWATDHPHGRLYEKVL
jgi:hypothetical protein